MRKNFTAITKKYVSSQHGFLHRENVNSKCVDRVVERFHADTSRSPDISPVVQQRGGQPIHESKRVAYTRGAKSVSRVLFLDRI